MNRFNPVRLNRLLLVVGMLALGLAAWIIVGSVVLMDSFRVVQTPTVSAATGTDQPLTIVITATPTSSSAITTLPPTQVSTQIATQIALAPTLDSPNTQSPTLVIPPTAMTAAASPANPPQTPSSANGCSIPAGWVAYTVEDGDTLFGFALGSGGKITVADVMTGNCLTNKLLTIGQSIFLPAGVADQSPKIDNSSPQTSGGTTSGAGSVPAGLSRAAQCPCTLAIRAGWRLEQIAAAVDDAPVGFSGADFMRTVAAGSSAPDQAFLLSRPAGKSLEGFMYPGTYSLDNTTTAVQFRDMMLGAFGGAINAQVQADAATQGLTFWQAVNLASIIQRESGTASEQKLIASVFHNRLAANKGLAATVTLQYGLGQAGNWWPRITSFASQSLYNTNTHTGLPPSPIDSPSLSAILAAVYPAQTNYLYFSARCGGGGNFYAATFAEFEQGLKCS
jgi:YceG-like family